MTKTETILLQIIHESTMRWEQKTHLVDHYQPVIDPDLFLHLKECIFEEMIEEIKICPKQETNAMWEAAIEQATGSTELIDTIYNIMPELRETTQTAS